MSDVFLIPELKPCHVKNARLLHNRDAVLPLLPKGLNVAEVGVALGDFSAKILQIMQPKNFVAIDTFVIHEYPMLWNTPTVEIFNNLTHEQFYRNRFKQQILDNTFTVKKGLSWDMMKTFPDNYFDMIYLDAGHDYDSVKNDIAVSKHKIRNDGYLIFNDYIMFDHIAMSPYGVVRAVNELCNEDNYEIIYFCFQHAMFCDIVLKKIV